MAGVGFVFGQREHLCIDLRGGFEFGNPHTSAFADIRFGFAFL